MKHLDEYRDGEAAQKLAAAIARTVTRPWTIMEVCGGQTHTHRQVRDRRDPAAGARAGPRARLPGLRHPLEMIDRAHAIASRPGRDLLLVRRHAARARARAATCCSSSRRGATSGSSIRRSTP